MQISPILRKALKHNRNIAFNKDLCEDSTTAFGIAKITLCIILVVIGKRMSKVEPFNFLSLSKTDIPKKMMLGHIILETYE